MEVIVVHALLTTALDHARPTIVQPSVQVEVDLVPAVIRVVPDT